MQGFALYETKFGFLKIAYKGNTITMIKKVHDADISDLGTKTELSDKAYTELLEYFEGKRQVFDIPLLLEGTDFQKKVWKALCDIPYGETRTYKEIAIAVGNEKACRAVGLANNKNPISIIVPCHRVIGSSGKLVGYAGGLDMKQELLNLEQN